MNHMNLLKSQWYGDDHACFKFQGLNVRLAFSVKGPRCHRFAPLFLRRREPKTRKATSTCDGQRIRCILVRGPARITELTFNLFGPSQLALTQCVDFPRADIFGVTHRSTDDDPGPPVLFGDD